MSDNTEEPAIYRVQVMVGVDVIAHSAGEAMTLAVEKVRDLVGDDPTEPHPKEAWVTGIVPCDELHADTTSVDGYMVFRRPLV